MPGYGQPGNQWRRGQCWPYKINVLEAVNGRLLLQELLIRFNTAAIVSLRMQGRFGLGKLLCFNIIELATISVETRAIIMIAEMRFEIKRIKTENKQEKYGASFSHAAKIEKKPIGATV